MKPLTYELNEILEKVFTEGYAHAKYEEGSKLGLIGTRNQARTAILSLMKSIVPERITVYDKGPWKAVDIYNACRKEMLRRIDGEA